MSRTDEPQRAEVDRVLHGLAVAAGHVEVTAQHAPVVVIAGQHVERHFERREQLAQLFVLLVARIVGEVAGHDHGIRLRPDRAHRLDCRGEPVDRPFACPRGADVGIAELGEEHAT